MVTWTYKYQVQATFKLSNMLGAALMLVADNILKLVQHKTLLLRTNFKMLSTTISTVPNLLLNIKVTLYLILTGPNNKTYFYSEIFIQNFYTPDEGLE